MYKDIKPMLNAEELINHLEAKGVKFELISKEDAKKYLEENNNYFKLSSYRKNFPKYDKEENEGKYIDLDFKMLVDLSIIDMRLRKTMLSMVLDLEHYAKVRLLSKVENETKDGYTLVEEYIQELKDKKEYVFLENELNKNIESTYCGDLVEKYKDEYPIWAFIEVIPFGRFIRFYMFVANKFQDKDMIDEAYLLKNVRELRNACAHNNCILNDLRAETSKYKTNYRIINEIAKIGISKDSRNKRMSNSRIQQIVTLLYLNKNIVTSKGVLNYQVKILQELKSRIEHHSDYYSKNTLIEANFVFLNKIIDNWYNNNI
ncbi:MAG: Abi family protein [Clostridia bacterium]|nr:Abi family protein [Clostridia bacterium]